LFIILQPKYAIGYAILQKNNPGKHDQSVVDK